MGCVYFSGAPRMQERSYGQINTPLRPGTCNISSRFYIDGTLSISTINRLFSLLIFQCSSSSASVVSIPSKMFPKFFPFRGRIFLHLSAPEPDLRLRCIGLQYCKLRHQELWSLDKGLVMGFSQLAQNRQLTGCAHP